MTRLTLILCGLLLTASLAYSQTSKPRPRHDTWYEQALRRINPDNTDFGSLWEQRKQAILSQLASRYFLYSAGSTLAVVLMFAVVLVQRVSHKRALELAAQSIADVLRHDEHSRQAAREAIRRYNEHIDACNQVVERRQDGLLKSVSAAESELHRVRQELADTRDENKALRNDLAKKAAPVSTPSPAQAVQSELEFTPGQYIARINALDKQLRAEQRKNQQLKGTSVNDHRA
jgi:hypothetical protein